MVFTIATNGYIKGFMTGSIYTGASKSVCLPGLSCYSCPGAVGSCPIGAYQAVVNTNNINVSFYIAGFLTVIGGFCGRFVCGWLCPFGLFEDLIYRIPSKHKLENIKGDRYLKYIKYIILAVFVAFLPAFVAGASGQGDPWFCKYICPSGTLMAGIPLVALNESIRTALGALFVWKAVFLAFLIFVSVFVYRPFCRYLCPLGAVYGFFNRVSVYKYSFNKESCVKCGECHKACLMGIKANEKANCADCIRCGKCVNSCMTGALSGWSLKLENKEKKE